MLRSHASRCRRALLLLLCMSAPCRLMVKLVGCSPVCERMKENSAAGTNRVALLSTTTLLGVLWGATSGAGAGAGGAAGGVVLR